LEQSIQLKIKEDADLAGLFPVSQPSKHSISFKLETLVPSQNKKSFPAQITETGDATEEIISEPGDILLKMESHLKLKFLTKE